MIKSTEKIMEAVQEVTISGVATKEDAQSIKDDMRDLETNLRFEIQKNANDNLKFQIIQTIAIVGVMVALFQFSS